LIDIDLGRRLQDAGRKLFAWTVNLSERMLELQQMGADGIISDRTDLLGKLRD
jgi:glycerophosphoryl diester phosphodiesterase